MKVVLLKTHIWNEDIEEMAIKIYNETYDFNIDFFILMNCDSLDIFNQIIEEKIRKITLVISEKNLKQIYPIGFFDMYLSNHWLMMWFYQNNKKYDYYWSIEYDVRIIGNSYNIWDHSEDIDFLHTGYIDQTEGIMTLEEKYKWPDFYTYAGNKLLEEERYFGNLQVSRYSNRLLQYLDKCFEEENGQDEIIIYSLILKGNYSMSNVFLNGLIKGIFTWNNRYINYNKEIYESLKNSNILGIFHPIK